MNIVSARDPRYSNALCSTVDIVVVTEEWGEIEFTADAEDAEEHGKALYDRIAVGEFGPVAPYVAPADPDPKEISRRQCAAELFGRSLITGQEAVAMTATATPPAAISAIFATLAEPARTFALIDFAAGSYLRDNPTFLLVLSAFLPSATSDDVAGFFRAAAKR
jgi:hypothetical protein